jgi:hypothetical protein
MGLTGLSDVTIKNFNISSQDIVNTPIAPQLAVTDPPVTANVNSFVITLKIANMDGYVFAAVGSNSSSLPTMLQVR